MLIAKLPVIKSAGENSNEAGAESIEALRSEMFERMSDRRMIALRVIGNENCDAYAEKHEWLKHEWLMR